MSDNNNEKPQIVKVTDAATATTVATDSQKQQQQQEDPGAVDIEGKTNVSRGIIGLVTTTTSEPGYITEGTVADKVNPPTRFQKPGSKTNPVTEEDLKKRIDLERAKAGMDSEVQEQRVVKMRTEMQGFKYTPPDHLKDIPGLDPTPDFTQEKEPNPDESQNESQIEVQ